MIIWLEALLASVAGTAAILTIIIIVYILIRRRRFASKQPPIVQVTNPDQSASTKTEKLQTELLQLRTRSYYPLFRSTKPFFDWSDHPALINDVVENGWSRFVFANSLPSSTSVRSSLFSSLRVTGDYNIITREVHQGSVDFLQKIQFNKINSNSAATSARSTVRMVLPLPGPPSRGFFPQEAYFEIMVLSSESTMVKSVNGGEGEKVKLIQQQRYNSWSSSVGLEKVKFGGGRRRGGGEGDTGVSMAMGLAVGGEATTKMPGSCSGSIGFHSNGSVYLGGMKLVFESEKEDWAQPGKVIGCGFNPRQKKVFFTVDSKLVHVIHCKSEEFGMPLYPILTASMDITILINLGQREFNYELANAYRTPNPCFIGPTIDSSTLVLGYEDSRELFSMDNIDDEWLNHNATIMHDKNNSNNTNNKKMIDYDEQSDVDLFEIVLDDTVS